MSDSAFRTAFHYQPESGYIGDPLAFVLDGEYHVFFQYHPCDGPDWNPWLTGTAHWGSSPRSDGSCGRPAYTLTYERAK